MNITEKQTLRQQMIAARNNVSTKEREQFVIQSRQRLGQIPAFQNAKTVMAYVDFRNEAPTESLIEEIIAQGKTFVLPLTDRSFHIIPYEIPVTDFVTFAKHAPFLKTSALGILEPDPRFCRKVNPRSIDFVLVPGVAFDGQGNRLGYGKGCYDEFLPQLRSAAPKFGVAYSFQVVPMLPAEPLDIPMDGLL